MKMSDLQQQGLPTYQEPDQPHAANLNFNKIQRPDRAQAKFPRPDRPIAPPPSKQRQAQMPSLYPPDALQKKKIKTQKILIVPAKGAYAGPVKIAQFDDEMTVEFPEDARFVQRLYYSIIYLKPSKWQLSTPPAGIGQKTLTLSVTPLQIRPGSDQRTSYLVVYVQINGKLKVQVPNTKKTGYGMGTTKRNQPQSIIDLSQLDPDPDCLPVPELAAEQPIMPKKNSGKTVNEMYPELVKILPRNAEIMSVSVVFSEQGQKVKLVTYDLPGKDVGPFVMELKEPPSTQKAKQDESELQPDSDSKRRLPPGTKLVSYKLTYRNGELFEFRREFSLIVIFSRQTFQSRSILLCRRPR